MTPEQIETLEAALAPQPIGWQSIESAPAPKNGGLVNLFGKHSGQHSDGFPAINKWCSGIGDWNVSADPLELTHWMLLPAAPEGGG